MSSKRTTSVESLPAFTIDGRVLSTALQAVKPYAAPKSSISVLRAVLMSAVGAGVTFITSDLTTRAEYEASAIVHDRGRILVPFGELEKLAQTCKADPRVTLRLNADRTQLLVEGSVTGSISVGEPDDFPAQATGDDHTKGVILQREKLLDALAWTAPAISPDETRPTLNCLDLHLREELVALVATDSYRLHARAVERIAGNVSDGDYQLNRDFVVPFAKQAGALLVGDAHLMFHYHTVAAVYPSWCRISSTGGAMTWTTAVHDGQFPDWVKLVPGLSAYTIYIVIERKHFDPVLASILKLSNRGNTPLRLLVDLDEAGQGKATISYESSDHSKVARSFPVNVYQPAAAPAKLEQPFEIGFNPEFFAQAVKCQKRVSLAGVSPLHPLMAYPDLDLHQFALVMPIRLND